MLRGKGSLVFIVVNFEGKNGPLSGRPSLKKIIKVQQDKYISTVEQHKYDFKKKLKKYDRLSLKRIRSLMIHGKSPQAFMRKVVLLCVRTGRKSSDD